MEVKIEELVDYLIRVSEGKLQLVKKLLELTIQQRDALKAVEDDDIDILNNLIQGKQETMNKIDILDQEFLGKFIKVKEILGIENFADLKEEPIAGVKILKEKIQEIMVVTEEISSVDKENTMKAQENLDEIKKQLKLVKIGKKTNHGYGKKFTENTSILIDKKK